MGFGFQPASLAAQPAQQGVTRDNRPQSRRLTASLFINTHEVMKKKRKFVVILTGHPVGNVEV
eukprot:1161729-Pelagomonas_calceolata.AAC.1